MVGQKSLDDCIYTTQIWYHSKSLKRNLVQYLCYIYKGDTEIKMLDRDKSKHFVCQQEEKI